MLHEFRKHLLVIHVVKSSNHYLLEKYTELRVYGFEEEPCHIPKFIQERVFSLKLMRQRISLDFMHFTSKSHKYHIIFPWILYSFTIKNKLVIEKINFLIKRFKFHIGEIWKYHPLNVVSNLDVKNHSHPYMHNWNLSLEMITYKNTWEEGQELKPMNMIKIKLERDMETILGTLATPVTPTKVISTTTD